MEKLFNCLLSDFESKKMNAQNVIMFVVTTLSKKHMEKTAERLSRMSEQRAMSHIYMLAGRECA